MAFHVVGILSVAILAFASANITDLFVLVSFFSKPKFHIKQIVIGQYLGVGILILICLTTAIFTLAFIPNELVRFLGIVPIGVGLKNLFRLGKKEPEEAELEKEVSRRIFSTNTLEVASIAFADCSDDLAIFIPLFIKETVVGRAITTIVFFILIGVWSAIAFYLVHNKKFGAPIRQYGALFAPLVLIGLGIFILV